MEITYQNPIFIWFLFGIPVLIITHFFTLRHMKRKALKFANFEAIERVTGKHILTKNIWLLAIRMFTIAFLIFSVTGVTIWYTGESTDFDYVLAIDTSSSMLADDFNPNRLEAAKDTALDFVDSLSSKTKMGVVSFSGTSIVEQKMTASIIDVKRKIQNLSISPTGGTDIAGAIVTSTNLLMNEEEARIIIILTDGQSNVGLPIETGIDYANSNRVMVYTIGVGTEGGGSFAGIDIISKLDEASLKRVAEDTGGKFFKAQDVEELRAAYGEIATTREKKLSIELRMPLLFIALILLMFEWGLINSKYRTLP